MPEAAEVRVAAAQLAHTLTGRAITAADVSHPRTIRSDPGADLSTLVGREVVGVRARGKWVIVDVGGPEVLGIHLRMSGLLLLVEPGTPEPDRHVHGRIELGPRSAAGLGQPRWGLPVDAAAPGRRTDPVLLWFRDPRTFGEWRLLDDEPQPVEIEQVDVEALVSVDGGRTIAAKALLLDQRAVVEGVGSYLADEAFARAGVAPGRSASSLTRHEWDAVMAAAGRLVEESAALGGVTLADEGWCDVWGRPGRFADRFLVHARDDCGRCGGPTIRAVISQRSARWCPACQPG